MASWYDDANFMLPRLNSMFPLLSTNLLYLFGAFVVPALILNWQTQKKFGYSVFSKTALVIFCSIDLMFIGMYFADIREKSTVELITAGLVCISACMLAYLLFRNCKLTDIRYGIAISFVQIPMIVFVGAIVLCWVGLRIISGGIGLFSPSNTIATSREDEKVRKAKQWHNNELNKNGPFHDPHET